MILFQVARPDSANLPLFLHVLGAMLLVGTLLAVAAAILLAWRRTDPSEATALTRLGLWTLLAGVFPSFVLMRVGAQWTESEEGLGDAKLSWIDIGYITADLGAVLTLISIVLAIIGLRRLRAGKGIGLGRAVGVISVLLLAAYLVAVWAMTTKPV
jgi:uncharacterized membrane protein